MKKDRLENLFEELKGQFDLEEPKAGHEDRFLRKLEGDKSGRVKNSWWKPISMAASVALLVGLGLWISGNELQGGDEIANMTPEISQTQVYFTTLIEEQVKTLEAVDSPGTDQLVQDALSQLEKLQQDYLKLEQDLLKGGDSKLILSAMITNFQTRIDLLDTVMKSIEKVKNLNTYDDENYTI